MVHRIEIERHQCSYAFANFPNRPSMRPSVPMPVGNLLRIVGLIVLTQLAEGPGNREILHNIVVNI